MVPHMFSISTELKLVMQLRVNDMSHVARAVVASSYFPPEVRRREYWGLGVFL